MRYERVPLHTDAGLGARARIGLLVLRTDQTFESDLRQVIQRLPDVAVYAARLWNDTEITRETLLAMKPLIADTARLLPAEWSFKSIGFACTSGAIVIGEAEVARLVRSVHSAAAVTDPVTAVIAALRALGVRRPALITPYARPVNDTIISGLAARGIEVPALASFEEPDDGVVARITQQAIADTARRVGAASDVDSVFVSCTSLRTLDVIGAIEQAIGMPATSSNHALIWHMLRLAGIQEPLDGLGRLYRVAPG
ncbi:MAG TPA: Asp/Glu racemase [Hyphomicrobiaceae bacterium]|nr:Asp/Glu racemase [Hyphomicrobiaceae bacterium]